MPILNPSDAGDDQQDSFAALQRTVHLRADLDLENVRLQPQESEQGLLHAIFPDLDD